MILSHTLNLPVSQLQTSKSRSRSE